MGKIIPEDALRRALSAIPGTEGVTWLDAHVRAARGPDLMPAGCWNMDTTIKPLSRKQEGAAVSTNPKTPGRPSHSLAGLMELLAGLPPKRKPARVRGECGFGADTLMRPLEERGQGYLFKLKLTRHVKRHIQR